MAAYGFRNNKFVAKILEASTITSKGVLEVSKTRTGAVSYVKFQACAVGTATSLNRFAYVFLGTAGRLCISSTVPVGTTGAFANKGSPLGTSA